MLILLIKPIRKSTLLYKNSLSHVSLLHFLLQWQGWFLAIVSDQIVNKLWWLALWYAF